MLVTPSWIFTLTPASDWQPWKLEAKTEITISECPAHVAQVEQGKYFSDNATVLSIEIGECFKFSDLIKLI